jgi:hypothetical protein
MADWIRGGAGYLARIPAFSSDVGGHDGEIRLLNPTSVYQSGNETCGRQRFHRPVPPPAADVGEYAHFLATHGRRIQTPELKPIPKFDTANK